MIITPKEFDEYAQHNDIVSDTDHTWPDGNPTIEWDGPYGRHISEYVSEEGRDAALEKHRKEITTWVIKRRVSLIKAKHDARRKHEAAHSLGGQFPELRMLKNNMSIA
jgi:hypothetical protein